MALPRRADVILAHSLLRAMPEVDPDRIGITGISWGGYLTCIVSGLDNRFKFAVPVYGCGFLGENSAWVPEFKRLGPKGDRWLAMWDPSHYLKNGKMPKLWVTGTNDFAYPMDSLAKVVSARRRPEHLVHPLANAARSQRPRREPARDPRVRKLDRGAREHHSPRSRNKAATASKVWARFRSETPITKAELLYTEDEGSWTQPPLANSTRGRRPVRTHRNCNPSADGERSTT